MAASSYGTRGAPKFADADAPDVAVNPTKSGEYAEIVGNRMVGTAAQRAAFATYWAGFSAVAPWNGLDWFETDTGYLYRRIAGAWKLWETSGPVDYYAAANLVNYTPGTDVPEMTWLARAGRILVEGKLALTNGTFGAGFAIKLPTAAPAHAKYGTTGRRTPVGDSIYSAAGTDFPMGVEIQSVATDRAIPLLAGNAGTYPSYATQVTASVPVPQSAGYVMTWNFEYQPA